MGDIYRGSFLTISALGAKDSHGGCFHTRTPLRYRPCRLTGDASKGMVVRGASLPKEWRDSSDNAPLHSRGWVMQERMLSPRTLHYGSKTMSWECIEFDASEAFPEGNTWDWNQDKRYRRPKEAFESLVLLPEDKPAGFVLSDDFKKFHHAWNEILRKYTCCSLTRREDKLVAINGIIRLTQQRTGLTNVAGLWKEYLLPELLWSTSSPATWRPDFFEPELYRAPTWSWASVDSVVHSELPNLIRGRYENILNLSMWISYELAWEAELREVNVTAKPNGQVSDGYIRLQGLIRKVEWTENSGTKGFRHNRQARSVSDRWLSDFRAGTSQEIWAILIARGKGSSNVKDARIDVGLVLEPVEGREHVFRRFAYFDQCYWSTDTYPVFAEGKGVERMVITII